MTTKTHPAFGHIMANRQSSNRDRLFGTVTQGYNCVSLCISTATYEHNPETGQCFINPDKRLIEVVMSPLQFTEMITGMNMREGAACTINWFGGKLLTMPDEETSPGGILADQFKADIDDMSRECDALVAKAKAFQDKPNIGKGDRAEFAKLAENLVGMVRSRIPYLSEKYAAITERMKTAILADKANKPL